MDQSAASHTHTPGSPDDPTYDTYLRRIQARFLLTTKNGGELVFTTDATGLYDLYLASFLDPVERQYHNCHCCRRFIETYGGLVTILRDGTTQSAIWDPEDAPPLYQPAVEGMARLARRARVTGPFFSTEVFWGKPITGPWKHYAIAPAVVFKESKVKSAWQAMAEKKEEHGTVAHALSEWTQGMLTTACEFLNSDEVYRSEKVLGQAVWLLTVQQTIDDHPKNVRSNLIWRAVAVAPTGFCHPRASMIATLMDDIAAGMPFEQVRNRFAEKMNPLLYQRPQAAPTAGGIRAAEKLVETLGLIPSLRRRYARLEEVQAIWTPTGKPATLADTDLPPSKGVFDHLKGQLAGPATPAMTLPAQVLTWVKFAATVLPTAPQIEIHAPAHGAYCAFVTAVDPNAPPILQWDTLEQRNPVSWYMYASGSGAHQWNLTPNQYCRVNAITLRPSAWFGRNDKHYSNAVIFIIDGAKDTRNEGSALFPEILKGELHGARAVFEAHSNAIRLEEPEKQSANGLMFDKNFSDVLLRVGRRLYRIDRWD